MLQLGEEMVYLYALIGFQGLMRRVAYSTFRLNEETCYRYFSPHPVPLPQGERGPKNNLFMQMQTAVMSAPSNALSRFRTL